MENLVINENFWRGKKVFITGHTGFKGGWLTLWLKKLGASIVGYALLPQKNPNLFELAEVATGINSIVGDILDADHLTQALTTHQPEIVFHLAAQPLVHYSYANPKETYNVNILGTVNLLEAVRTVNSVKVVIIVTSDKCYENQEWVWGYRENDAMGGFDPYSSSKGCVELIVSAYRRSYFHGAKSHQHNVALASVRSGNVIGGGDWSEARLIPDLIQSFVNGAAAVIRNPHACRPWQFVLDVLQGYLLLAEKMFYEGASYASAWNFGPDETNIKPVAWIADQLAELWGENATWICETQNQLHEAKCLKLDCNKSRSFLGWQPTLTIQQSLRKTFEWYKAHQHQNNMQKFTEDQILVYSKAAEVING